MMLLTDKLPYVNNKSQKDLLAWLTSEAQQFLSMHFQLDLKIPIRINGRLKRVLGAYKLDAKKQPKQIDLAASLIENGDKEIILDVLKHELVHYGLHGQQKPFTDQSKEFKETCRRLNISLTRTYTGANTHLYKCSCQKYELQRKLRLNKGYFCTKCKSRLIYLGPLPPNITKMRD